MLSTSRLESSHLIAKNQGFFFCSIYARRETIVDLPSASALKSNNNYCRFQRLSMNSNSVALFASVVQLLIRSAPAFATSEHCAELHCDHWLFPPFLLFLPCPVIGTFSSRLLFLDAPSSATVYVYVCVCLLWIKSRCVSVCSRQTG